MQRLAQEGGGCVCVGRSSCCRHLGVGRLEGVRALAWLSVKAWRDCCGELEDDHPSWERGCGMDLPVDDLPVGFLRVDGLAAKSEYLVAGASSECGHYGCTIADV